MFVRDLGGAASNREGWEFPARNRNTMAIVGQLRKRDVVDAGYYEAVRALSDLRNQVAHGAVRVDHAVAATYVAAVNELIRTTLTIIEYRYGVHGNGHSG